MTSKKVFIERDFILNTVLIKLAEWHNEDVLRWNDSKNIPILKAQFGAWLDVNSLLRYGVRKIKY